MFLIRKKDNKEHTPKSLSDSQSDKRNPFKVAGVQPDVEKTPFHNKGTSVFDSMEKVKLGRLSSSTGRSSITDSSEIPSRAVKKIRTQSKLQDNSGKQKVLASENDCNENAEISTFDVWFEMNKQKLLAEYGESCEESELTVKAMHKYRQLIKGQRKTNTRESTENAVSSKRRKDDVNDSEENLKNSLDAEPFENGSNKLHGKLSGFVFNKNV